MPVAKQKELREYAQKLNELEGEERASSYLERWQKLAGKIVKVFLSNAGALLTKTGRFMGLKLVKDNCLAQVEMVIFIIISRTN
ncbi:MAG: hypothetical protein QNJ54_16475 [Prochloraceae cyanobacterium]|nr:hypothetical protein [Prochloraceae cyanobacterium]